MVLLALPVILERKDPRVILAKMVLPVPLAKTA